MNAYKKTTLCRICGRRDLVQFLDLGNQPLANSFLVPGTSVASENRYPLAVNFCNDCHLSQLTAVVSPEVLFRDYIYFSSGMPVLSKHFGDYAEEVMRKFIKEKGRLAVEIGSNDGLLLEALRGMGARVLGIDPALNIARQANERGVETIGDFFSEKLADEIVKKYGKARTIIGNNVVAHIDNHHDLARGIEKLLAEDGVFAFEAPYIVDMFENLTFDTIYHEHLSYLSVRPLVKFFNGFGLDVFDVKIFPVQGNSLRVYVCKTGTRAIEPSVGELMKKELDMSLDKADSYFVLARRIENLKESVVEVLVDLKKSGKKLAAYGAPAKGNTLLNYFGIGQNFLEYATEALPSKIGLLTPGMHIPVVDIQWARNNPPDFYLLLAWNYKDAVLEKEKEFRNKGGRFIMPVGDIRVI